MREIIKECIKRDNIFWKEHFLQRMRSRNINLTQIFAVLDGFEIIAKYLDDKPFPSYLILGYSKNIPYHIVIGVNREDKELYMITVYKPNLLIWEKNYKKRKK